MANWLGRICLLLLLSTTLVLGKGGGGRGGGGGRSGGSRGGSSKSGGSKYPSGSGSSYPKQEYRPAPAPPPAPPSYPSYPNRNPSPGQAHNPSYNPNYPAPPAYSAPGHAYPAPPAYSAPGHAYPAPPGYSAPGHPYPAPPGYPSGPRPPSYPSGGYPGSYPVGPMHPPKSGSGVGTNFAAGVAGGVIGGAVAGQVFNRPRLYVPIGGYHGHHGYHGHRGYGDSSSEEYFTPYITDSHGRIQYRDRPGYQMTEEGRKIVELTRSLQILCEKLQQPSACAAFKVQGVRPFTHPNSIFNGPQEPGRGPIPPYINSTITDTNPRVLVNSTMPVEPVNNTMPVTPVSKIYPDLPVNNTFNETNPLAGLEIPKVLGTTLIPPAPTTTPHMNEDRLKAVEDMLKALDEG